MAKKRKETAYEELIEKALENAISDRERAIEAFDKTKSIYDIDPGNASSIQGLMLLGQSVPKLLDIANKSNEQIIRLAQIREKEQARDLKSKEEEEPFNVEEIVNKIEKKSLRSN